MTLIIDNDGVRSTKSTEVKMGKAKIKVGRDLVNEEKTSFYETDLEVDQDLIQKGNFTVNDPQIFTRTVLSLAKTAENVTAFGTKVLKLMSE